MEKYIIEAFFALAGGLFTCYGLLYQKASKKDFEEFTDEIERKIASYATKEDFRTFKEDILRAIKQNNDNVSKRIEDKFDTILAILKNSAR